MEKLNEITNQLRRSSDEANYPNNIKVTPIVSDEKQSKNVSDKTKLNSVLNGDYNSSSETSTPNHSRYGCSINDLIPYPSSSISTIIEKGNGTTINWLQYNANNFSKMKKKKKKSIDQTSSQVDSVSETASQISRSDVQTHFNDDDITRIVKYLKEKKDESTQTIKHTSNQYVQANISSDGGNDTGMFELQRSNQTLRAQLEQLSFVVEEMSKERSNTNLQMHYLQKQANVKELKIEEINARNEQLLADNDELRYGMKNLENLVDDYQKQLTTVKQENANLQQQLTQSSSERNNLSLQLEELKHKVFYKDTVIFELDASNVNNKQEISNLNHQISLLRQQAPRDVTLPYPPPPELNSLKQKLVSLRNECAELKSEFVMDFNLIADLLRNATEQSARLKAVPSADQSIVSQLQSDIANLLKTNEKLMLDKEREKGHNIELNMEFNSRLNNIQIENEDLKQLKVNLEAEILAVKGDREKWLEENRNIQLQLDEYRSQNNQLQMRLEEKASQLSDSSQVSADEVAQLKNENADLKEIMAKLEENGRLLKVKLEENENDSTKSLQHLQQKIQNLKEISEREKATLQTEMSGLRSELESKQKLILNLESNVQALNEDCARVQVECSKLADSLQSGQNENSELARVLAEKEAELGRQSSQLSEVLTQLEQSSSHKSELNDRIQYLEKAINNRQAEEIHDDQVELNRRIIELESELFKEKERSKGMSQLLFNEKRANSKLKAKLADCLKPPQQQQQQLQGETKTNEEIIDVEQAKLELMQRIKQLKEFLFKNDPTVFDSGSQSMASHSTLSAIDEQRSAASLPPGDGFISQILEQSEQQINKNQEK